MGKTAAGAVWLDAERTSPYDFYQYWVNVDDRDVSRFLRLYTLLGPAEIEKLEELEGADIREAKKVLAREVTTLVHGTEEAAGRREGRRRPVRRRGRRRAPCPRANAPRPISRATGCGLLDALVDSGLMKSKGEARRMIRQKAVRVGGELVTDETLHADRRPHRRTAGSPCRWGRSGITTSWWACRTRIRDLRCCQVRIVWYSMGQYLSHLLAGK